MAFTTSLNATLFVPARILFVLGEDRVLPGWLARVSGRFRTPWLSLVINTVLALVLIWTKEFGYVLNAALLAMFLFYGLHSAALIALPLVHPELYESAEVRLRPSLLVACGSVSVLAMAYLSFMTISNDLARREALPEVERGISLWLLLFLWTAVGTILYALARWEGRRRGFDYERQLSAELNEEKDNSGISAVQEAGPA
jgi:amino acid transporter